jgi:hypothetical protein
MSGINAPDRRELYELDDGEKPYVASSCLNCSLTPTTRSVEIYEDTKIPNAITVKVVKQDHTLANMLRACVHPSSLRPARLTFRRHRQPTAFDACRAFRGV